MLLSGHDPSSGADNVAHVVFSQTPVSAGVQLGFASGRNRWGAEKEGEKGCKGISSPVSGSREVSSLASASSGHICPASGLHALPHAFVLLS